MVLNYCIKDFIASVIEADDYNKCEFISVFFCVNHSSVLKDDLVPWEGKVVAIICYHELTIHTNWKILRDNLKPI